MGIPGGRFNILPAFIILEKSTNKKQNIYGLIGLRGLPDGSFGGTRLELD